MGASQDIALPYMTDQRHAEDTFFIVAEADHRFYKADCIPPEEWLQVAGKEHYGHDESVAAAALAEEASKAEPSAGSSSRWNTNTKRKREQSHAEPSAGQQRKYGAWEAGHKHMLPRQAVDELVTDELRGLVAMANLAARRGCGDFIWYSWNPSSQKGKSGRLHSVPSWSASREQGPRSSPRKCISSRRRKSITLYLSSGCTGCRTTAAMCIRQLATSTPTKAARPQAFASPCLTSIGCSASLSFQVRVGEVAR